MVSNAHPSPWFANTITRAVDTDGTVFDRDSPRWLLLPVTDRGGKDVERGGRRDEQGGKRGLKPRHLVLDVRLLARVSLVDDRGCMGPEGNATAYGKLNRYEE